MADYELDNNGLHNLMCAVFEKAVLDWRMLIRKKAWKKDTTYKHSEKVFVTFDELRRFFKSDWAEFYTFGTKIEPLEILKLLEKELEEAKEKEEKERRNGHKKRAVRH